MQTNLDQTLIAPFADPDPFAYGEHTVVQLRAQPFEVQDELGTVVTMPIDTTPRNPLAAVPAGPVAVEEDPMTRLERKLDAALRQIAKLQQTIESLDLTLARALSR
jgi:hypothetical protein